MPNILILYATREGQTEKIAGKLASRLAERDAKVTLVNAKDKQSVGKLVLDSFDLIVFGASMHAGNIESELRDFIRQNKTLIETKRCAFYLVLLSAATNDLTLKEKWLSDAGGKLRTSVGVSFDHVEFIAGALSYSKYSRPVRWILSRIAKKAGADTDTSKDYEYTDWQQVEAFADKLLHLTSD